MEILRKAKLVLCFSHFFTNTVDCFIHFFASVRSKSSHNKKYLKNKKKLDLVNIDRIFFEFCKNYLLSILKPECFSFESDTLF